MKPTAFQFEFLPYEPIDQSQAKRIIDGRTGRRGAISDEAGQFVGKRAGSAAAAAQARSKATTVATANALLAAPILCRESNSSPPAPPRFDLYSVDICHSVKVLSLAINNRDSWKAPILSSIGPFSQLPLKMNRLRWPLIGRALSG
jgi:hypothetical protein